MEGKNEVDRKSPYKRMTEKGLRKGRTEVQRKAHVKGKNRVSEKSPCDGRRTEGSKEGKKEGGKERHHQI